MGDNVARVDGGEAARLRDENSRLLELVASLTTRLGHAAEVLSRCAERGTVLRCLACTACRGRGRFEHSATCHWCAGSGLELLAPAGADAPKPAQADPPPDLGALLRPTQGHRLPLPRLQLVWEDGGRDGDLYVSYCRYVVVIPVDRYDVRNLAADKDAGPGWTAALLGTTRCRSGRQAADLETPFRDGCHIEWDAAALGWPAYVSRGAAWRQLPGKPGVAVVAAPVVVAEDEHDADTRAALGRQVRHRGLKADELERSPYWRADLAPMGCTSDGVMWARGGIDWEAYDRDVDAIGNACVARAARQVAAPAVVAAGPTGAATCPCGVPHVPMDLTAPGDGWARLERVRFGQFDSTLVLWDQAAAMLAERDRLIAVAAGVAAPAVVAEDDTDADDVPGHDLGGEG